MGVDTTALSNGLKQSENEVKTWGQNVKGYALAAGVALTAVGMAGLKLSDDARKVNATIGFTALNLGITTKEMRKVELATADVGLSVKEAAKTFDILARAGMKNTTEMAATTKAFDALGHVAGLDADTVTEMLVPSFKALGQELPKSADDLDALSWMVRNTTTDLSDFSSAMAWVARAGGELGVTMEDMVAILAVMQSRGIQGTVATRMMRSAVTEATEKHISLNEQLKISQEEMNKYKDILGDATGITEDYAKVAETQYGVMDRIKRKFEELTLSAGSALTPMEPLLAATSALGISLMAVGPASKGIGVAMGLLANPVGAIVIAIVAIAGAVALLYKFWDKIPWYVKLFMTLTTPIWRIVAALKAISNHWDQIKDVATKAINKIKEAWSTLGDKFKPVADKLAMVGEKIKGVIGWVHQLTQGWDYMELAGMQAINGILGVLEKLYGWLPLIGDKIGDKIGDAKAKIGDMIDHKKLEIAADKVKATVKDMAESIAVDLKAAREAEQAAALAPFEALRAKAVQDNKDTIAAIQASYGALDEASKTAPDEESRRALEAEARAKLNMEVDTYEAIHKVNEAITDDDRKLHFTKMEWASIETERERIQIEATIAAENEAYQKRLTALETFYNAKMDKVDTDTQAVVDGYQDQIDALDKMTKDEERILKAAEDKRRLRELQFAADTIEGEKKRLEEITGRRLKELQNIVDTAKTEEEKAKAQHLMLLVQRRSEEDMKAIDKKGTEAQADLDEEVAKQAQEQIKELRDDQKEALQVKIKDAQKAADTEKTRLQKEWDFKKTGEENSLKTTLSNLETEKNALDYNLKVKLQLLDDAKNVEIAKANETLAVLTGPESPLTQQENAIKAVYALILDDTKIMFDAIAQAMSQLSADQLQALTDWANAQAGADETAKTNTKSTWDNIRDTITSHWAEILAVLFPPIGLPLLIQQHWGEVVTVATAIFDGVRSAAHTAFDTLGDIILWPFRTAIRGVGDALNFLIREMNKVSWTPPGWLQALGVGKVGINLPSIAVPTWAKGGVITEPSLIYGLRSMRPIAIAGERGPERVGGAIGNTNNFQIGTLAVREEADIYRIAAQLKRMMDREKSKRGI